MAAKKHVEWAYVSEAGQVLCPRCMGARFVVLNQVEKDLELLCYATCSACAHDFVFRKDKGGHVLG